MSTTGIGVWSRNMNTTRMGEWDMNTSGMGDERIILC